MYGQKLSFITICAKMEIGKQLFKKWEKLTARLKSGRMMQLLSRCRLLSTLQHYFSRVKY